MPANARAARRGLSLPLFLMIGSPPRGPVTTVIRLASAPRRTYKALAKWNRSRVWMPTKTTWRHWLERLYNLRRDRRGTYERPHKPVLLLAILDLLDCGLLTKNEVPLSPDLVRVFKQYFAVVRRHNDQPAIENPFYFLAGDGFWELVPKAGGRPLYEPGNASRAPTLRTLRQVYGRFDSDFYETIL